MSNQAKVFLEAWAQENVKPCPQARWEETVELWKRQCIEAAGRVGVSSDDLEAAAQDETGGYDLVVYLERKLDDTLSSDQTWQTPEA